MPTASFPTTVDYSQLLSPAFILLPNSSCLYQNAYFNRLAYIYQKHLTLTISETEIMIFPLFHPLLVFYVIVNGASSIQLVLKPKTRSYSCQFSLLHLSQWAQPMRKSCIFAETSLSSIYFSLYSHSHCLTLSLMWSTTVSSILIFLYPLLTLPNRSPQWSLPDRPPSRLLSLCPLSFSLSFYFFSNFIFRIITD